MSKKIKRREKTMLKFTRENRETTIQRIYEGQIDTAMLSTSSLIDDIVLTILMIFLSLQNMVLKAIMEVGLLPSLQKNFQ